MTITSFTPNSQVISHTRPRTKSDNALTLRGREDAKGMAKQLSTIGFSPTFIWTSNTERAYETAVVIARELQLGQNRIIPEYSFLDARSAGIFEDRDADATWKIIHEMDEKEGILWKPPKNSDGTPNESVTDVLVRGNQLVSTIESMHSGENVLIISPDSENLSILEAALEDANPDSSLLRHARFAFKNAEVRPLHPNVVARTTLATGQTQEEVHFHSNLDCVVSMFINYRSLLYLYFLRPMHLQEK